MSDSRLEKFIYAICSMDVSDLPVPLSRIEKLWNCLITGETPDFEPLSRNEKYLMAMLDRYDISNLPAPMSRGEQLLYKIAVGETDLSDVPGYLSRYEELLKYLIENGEISEDDFEYVLYTLNQSLHTLYLTAEKPVKSAILKGQTLVNLFDGEKMSLNEAKHYTYSNGIIESAVDGQPWSSKTNLSSAIKPMTKYLLKVKNVGEYSLNIEIRTDLSTLLHQQAVSVGQEVIKIIETGEKIDGLYVKVYPQVIGDDLFAQAKLNIIEYQDGMESWDIPYFEGMQSVKMPVLTTIGKNLVVKPQYGYVANGVINTGVKAWINSDYVYVKGLKEVVGSTSSSITGATNIATYDKNKQLLRALNGHSNITLNDDEYYVIFSRRKLDNTEFTSEELLNSQMQLEVGSVATTYEPYKSNILSTPSDLELRGIGDVQDKLDCLTGEVTESIREIVLDGTQYMDADGRGIYIQVDDMKKVEDYRTIITCDKLPVFYHQWDLPNVENGIAGYLDEENKYPGQNWLYIKVNNSIDVGEVRQILTQNPITAQYELSVESIKTVDLTVVDQDNQPTELGTFENVTHVSLEAENLIPEVEMEVATNLLEDTVFNLTSAFNTLYPTAAKPVKSAILKGQTLVNLVTQKSGSFNGTRFLRIPLGHTIKANTKYFVKFNLRESSLTNGVTCRLKNDTNGGVVGSLHSDGIITITGDGYNYIEFFIRNADDITNGLDAVVDDIMVIEYQGGMENWDIPYFEGMQSVKMPVLTTTGKNLFDESQASEQLSWGNNVKKANVKENTTYVYSSSSYKGYVSFKFYDNNDNEIGQGISINSGTSFTTPPNTSYLKTHTDNDSLVQIEEGSAATPYEPYKSNILSTSEDVELRGIGDVKDELNVVTGELTERIGEVVFDGSESWVSHAEKTNTKVYRLPYPKLVHVDNHILCDKLPIATPGDVEKIATSRDAGPEDCYAFYIAISKTKANTLSDFKSYLSKNPLTVQYELETPTTKTVDLTVIDQDNQPTQLGTFDDTTHVLLESEGLIPTASLTVRTKIPSASSTSLLMDDISTEQQQLETTVDEQSNNVDATMIATTEIFEDTL